MDHIDREIDRVVTFRIIKFGGIAIATAFVCYILGTADMSPVGKGLATIAQAFALLSLAAILLGVYAVPTFIAWRRGHRNLIPLGIINFFFGWTLLGWVACLAWSLSTDVKHIET